MILRIDERNDCFVREREIECVVLKRRMRRLGSDLNEGEDMDGC